MRRTLIRSLPIAVVLFFIEGIAFAQDGGISRGDTAWMLASSALVLFMTPGLALFYGGMVRSKNVLTTIMHSFIAMGVISVLWVLVGYSLAFGGDSSLIGNLEWLGFNGVSVFEPNPDYGATIPHQLYAVYQGMFAIITPALITGGFAERKKFSSYLVFLILWSLLVYCPIAHWVWGKGGWLRSLGTTTGGGTVGALDFAGGTVVHISSGITALVAALIIGRRRGYPGEEMRPNNLTMTMLGTGILWFGWFGFNAGSAVAANGVAVNAFVVTNTAAAMAALAWMAAEWTYRGKPTTLGAASGAVAGLVGITPAAGFVNPLGAIAIGIGAGVLCYSAVIMKTKLGYDDSLDTFGVHAVGGTWGALATGLFAVPVLCQAATGVKDHGGGLLAGNPQQFLFQATGVVATIVYAAVVSAILLFIINAVIGLRVKSGEEDAGLDVSLHGEEGYIL
ncbi:MAG: ammonium transporter [Armatimonadetes bacterium]|nr:ammonium transporter [Armatimonadota bacterium]